jgi:aminocarboxymuconate-semialdehyde decarboxylase
MNIDLHSHFFPVDALRKPGKYEHRAPEIVLDGGKLFVRSQIGFRPGLGAGAYDPLARIKALDEMQIDLQALSPSPILLFYWEEPAVAAHFTRRQNEAIQQVAQKYPDRFVAVDDKPLDDPSFEPFFEAAQRLDMLLFVHPLEGGLNADDSLSPVLGNVLQFTFRTTMMVERMILTGMFEKYPNLRLCLSHGGGLLAFNIWRLDHYMAPRSFIRIASRIEKNRSAETVGVFEESLF